MSSHDDEKPKSGTLGAGTGAGKRVANSGSPGAAIAVSCAGRLGGVSERRSIPCSSAVHRCLLVMTSSSSAGDCGHDGSLRFFGGVCSSVSVVRRCRFMRESGSSSSTGEGDSERSNIEDDLRFKVFGLNQGCSCAGCIQEHDTMRPDAPTTGSVNQSNSQ